MRLAGTATAVRVGAAFLGPLLLLLLGTFILLFDPFHVDIVRGLGGEQESKSVLTAPTFYLRSLPEIAEPAPIAASIVYLGLVG